MWMEKQLQTEMWSVITQTLTCAKQVYTRLRDARESGTAAREDGRDWNLLPTLEAAWQAESVQLATLAG